MEGLLIVEKADDRILCLLGALGEECVEDMKRPRQDKDLEAMLGYQMRAPETTRQ